MLPTQADMWVCSPFLLLSAVAAHGVFDMHFSLSQLSAAALHEGSSPLSQDQPGDEQRQKGTLHSFAQAQLLKIKQTMKSEQSNCIPPARYSLDMDPTLQKLNVVKWLEVTLPMPLFGIM